MMTVIYAIWTYSKSKHPYEVIYDTIPFSAKRSLVSSNWKELGRRKATPLEEQDVNESGNTRRYLLCHYSDIDKLISDDMNYGISTPTEVIKAMRNHYNKNK